MGMVKIRRSPTMDLGAANHVMPIGGPILLTVMKSLGFLSGLHYVEADGT